MDSATQVQILTATRYLLMLAGTWLAAHGYIKNTEINDTVSALLIVGPVVWGFITNYLKTAEAKRSLTDAVNSGVKAAVAAQGGDATATPLLSHDDAKTIVATYGTEPPK